LIFWLDFFDSKAERKGSVARDAQQRAAAAGDNRPEIMPIRGSQQRVQIQVFLISELG
jgi:hypothetical protein